MVQEKILVLDNVKVSFKYQGRNIQVVRGVDFEVSEGKIIGILGESGSGKTITALSILGMIRHEDGSYDSGSIYYKGEDLLKFSEKQMMKIRGKEICYVFQNPVASLNPFKRVGKQIEEVLKEHGMDCSKEVVIEAMRVVGIDNAEVVYSMYPTQLSGGQCQRIGLAMCIVLRPKIIIADEPTSAIDASLQKKVLELFKDINNKYNTTMIIITHDFDVARIMCDEVVIMYGGLVMEHGEMKDILESPLHPYTKELISCVDSLKGSGERLYTLEGNAIAPSDFTDLCPFYDRCKQKTDKCNKEIPMLVSINNKRKVRCVNL
jgi:oligopeptide/dipeptide ABC transporter ATP-binding protein